MWPAIQGVPFKAHEVVCEQLGFAGAHPNPNGLSGLDILTDRDIQFNYNISCTGTEARLEDCSFTGLFPDYQYSTEVAAVVCTPHEGECRAARRATEQGQAGCAGHTAPCWAASARPCSQRSSTNWEVCLLAVWQ